MKETDIYNSKGRGILPENLQKMVDIAVFAGQSNMSGRGDSKKLYQAILMQDLNINL